METAILKNIFTNELYRHINGDEYENVISKKRGFVSPEKAKEVFRLNVDATMICNQYPLVEELIQKLNLKIEK